MNHLYYFAFKSPLGRWMFGCAAIFAACSIAAGGHPEAHPLIAAVLTVLALQVFVSTFHAGLPFVIAKEAVAANRYIAPPGTHYDTRVLVPMLLHRLQLDTDEGHLQRRKLQALAANTSLGVAVGDLGR